MNWLSESEKKVPTYGVCIQIESTQIRTQKIKKLEVKHIMTVLGLRVDKNGKEQVFKIDELNHIEDEKKFLRKYLVFEIPEEKG